jgi:hypothetical protein
MYAIEASCGCVIDAKTVTGSHTFEQICGAWEPLETVDLRNLLDGEPVLDQGSTESCVRHALARAIQLSARARGLKKFELPSPRHITSLTAALLNRALPLGGVTLGAAIEAVQLGGFCRESQCPWDAARDGETYLEDLQDGLDQREIRAHRIYSEYSDRGYQVNQAIDQGCGVIIGTSVDQPFMDYCGDSVWYQGTRILGYHAMPLVAYTPDYYVALNSYGAHWGDNGYVKISRSQVVDPIRTGSVWCVDFAPEYGL